MLRAVTVYCVRSLFGLPVLIRFVRLFRVFLPQIQENNALLAVSNQFPDPGPLAPYSVTTLSPAEPTGLDTSGSALCCMRRGSRCFAFGTSSAPAHSGTEALRYAAAVTDARVLPPTDIHAAVSLCVLIP